MKTTGWAIIAFFLVFTGILSACAGNQPALETPSATPSLTLTSMSTLPRQPAVYVSPQFTRTPGPTATQTVPMAEVIGAETASLTPSLTILAQNSSLPDSSSSASPTITLTLTAGPSPTRSLTPLIPPTLAPVEWTATPTPPISPTYVQCDSSVDYDTELALIDIINQYRASAGLEALEFSPPLAEASRKHSQDMACRDFYNHIGSNGSTFAQRISAEGYQFVQAAENIYVGRGEYDDPQKAFEAWQSGYVSNIQMLSAAYTEVGIGYIYKSDSTYGGYFTAVFALPAGGGQ